jgi:hypothetical protein
MRLAILLLLATIIIAEPVIHTHPLQAVTDGASGTLSASSVCAICAVGAGQAVIRLPVVTILVITSPVIQVSIDSESADPPPAGTSRAPPAA